MEVQVEETVYSLFGVAPILEALDEEVIRPLSHLRYGTGSSATPTAPKAIFIKGRLGRAFCSVIVNELRRGRSNKRGDIHYKNRDVKYLEWGFKNRNADEFTKIFEEAKNNEFTVLAIHKFEKVCPNADFEMELVNPAVIKVALLQQLQDIQPGKILIVATSNHMNSCDAEVMTMMEQKYELRRPDPETRQEIILGMMEYENAELAPVTIIRKVVAATRGDNVKEIMGLVKDALRKARRRRARGRQPTGQDGTLEVGLRDWDEELGLTWEMGPQEEQRQSDDDDEDGEDSDDEDDEDEVGDNDNEARVNEADEGVADGDIV